mgnify:CR=1 FL=1
MASIRKRGNSYLLVVSMGYDPEGHRRKPQQQRPVQRKHSPARHKKPPSLPGSMGRKEGRYTKEAEPPKKLCLRY